jgi:hypothetical protein
VTEPSWTWVGTGPPAGIQLSSGRLLIPAYHSSTPDDDGEFSTGHTMYSDDRGQTWKLGGTILFSLFIFVFLLLLLFLLFPSFSCTLFFVSLTMSCLRCAICIFCSRSGFFSYKDQFPNECQAVEVSPNRVFINSRGLWTSRLHAWSEDGGQTFTDVGIIEDLEQPLEGCEGSTIRHPQSGLLFYSGPFDLSPVRYNSECFLPSLSGCLMCFLYDDDSVSLFVSHDNATSWHALKVLDAPAGSKQSAAYSSLQVLTDGAVAICYEWANNTDLIFTPDEIRFQQVLSASEVSALATAHSG